MDPKSLRLIEPSANIVVEVKTVKCSLALPKTLDASLYSIKEGLQERWVCRVWERRHGRAHVANKDFGMALVLAIDL